MKYAADYQRMRRKTDRHTNMYRNPLLGVDDRENLIGNVHMSYTMHGTIPFLCHITFYSRQGSGPLLFPPVSETKN